MLATSDTCPDADWYEFETTKVVVINKCAIPLADHMSAKDARMFYTKARHLAGR